MMQTTILNFNDEYMINNLFKYFLLCRLYVIISRRLMQEIPLNIFGRSVTCFFGSDAYENSFQCIVHVIVKTIFIYPTVLEIAIMLCML